jgi:hypothetical protein
LPPSTLRYTKWKAIYFFAACGTSIRPNPFAKLGSNPAVELGEGVGWRGVEGLIFGNFQEIATLPVLLLDRQVRM